MNKQLLAVILVIKAASLAHPAYAVPDATAHPSVVVVVPERTQRAMLRSELGRTMTKAEWQRLAVALDDVRHLELGTTRAGVLRDFTPLSNEIFNDRQRRFVLKSYPDLLVNLRFSDASAAHGISPDVPAFQTADHTENLTDVITSIHLYYTGPATEKRHTVIF